MIIDIIRNDMILGNSMHEEIHFRYLIFIAVGLNFKFPNVNMFTVKIVHYTTTK